MRAMALWTSGPPSCSYTAHWDSGVPMAPQAWRNCAMRGNLQVCGALRNDSLPKKKHQEKDDWFAEVEDEVKPFLDLQRESALKLKTMRHYELMYLVHEAKVGELQDIVKKFNDFVKKKKGRIWRLNDWGMRRLAYKIQRTWRANYILMNIEIGSEHINELNMLLEKDERVIRHLVMKEKRAITTPSVPPEELPPSSKELRDAELVAAGLEIEDDDDGDEYAAGGIEDDDDEDADADAAEAEVAGNEDEDEVEATDATKKPAKPGGFRKNKARVK